MSTVSQDFWSVISCVRNVVAADAILFLLIHRFQMSRNYRLLSTTGMQ
jgi:hypothetical protein